MKGLRIMTILGAVIMLNAAIIWGGGPQPQRLFARLSGFNETPQALSTAAQGTFKAEIINETSINFTLSYSGLEGNVTQAHIHFGRPAITGGITIWLCGTATNPGPAGTLACAAPSGTVTGVVDASDVIGPAGQGIAAGEFAEVLRAIRGGATYANVHSSLYPSGEIRGPIHVIKKKNDHDDDDDHDD